MPSCFNHVGLFTALWTVSCQAPLPMGFRRQEFWSGLPFPPPGDLPHPASLMSPALAGRLFTTSATWEEKLMEGMATHSSVLAWRIPMDRGAWWAIVHGVAKSRARLSD